MEVRKDRIVRHLLRLPHSTYRATHTSPLVNEKDVHKSEEEKIEILRLSQSIASHGLQLSGSSVDRLGGAPRFHLSPGNEVIKTCCALSLDKPTRLPGDLILFSPLPEIRTELKSDLKIADFQNVLGDDVENEAPVNLLNDIENLKDLLLKAIAPLVNAHLLERPSVEGSLWAHVNSAITQHLTTEVLRTPTAIVTVRKPNKKYETKLSSDSLDNFNDFLDKIKKNIMGSKIMNTIPMIGAEVGRIITEIIQSTKDDEKVKELGDMLDTKVGDLKVSLHTKIVKGEVLKFFSDHLFVERSLANNKILSANVSFAMLEGKDMGSEYLIRGAFSQHKLNGTDPLNVNTNKVFETYMDLYCKQNKNNPPGILGLQEYVAGKLPKTLGHYTSGQVIATVSGREGSAICVHESCLDTEARKMNKRIQDLIPLVGPVWAVAKGGRTFSAAVACFAQNKTLILNIHGPNPSDEADGGYRLKDETERADLKDAFVLVPQEIIDMFFQEGAEEPFQTNNKLFLEKWLSYVLLAEGAGDEDNRAFKDRDKSLMLYKLLRELYEECKYRLIVMGDFNDASELYRPGGTLA